MRGRIRACDTCRNKKVKCEGTNPCKYCIRHSSQCTFNDIPKKLVPYSFKKKSDIVGVRNSSILKNTDAEIRSRLIKMELLLKSITKKLDKQHNNTVIDNRTMSAISTESDLGARSFETITETESDCEKVQSLVVGNSNSSSFESYDKMIFGDYFSVSVLSANGLMWAADRLQNPFVFNPVKTLISKFVSFERSLLSVWTDPVDTSRLAVLPPREIMDLFTGTYIEVCLFDLPYISDVKKLSLQYCDYRDGLIPQPKLSYGELLFLNSCLLLGVTAYFERLKSGMVESIVTKEEVKSYDRALLDNTLYYFHRVSVMGDGIAAIKGLTLLCFYSHLHSFTQPFYSITSHAVRQAQDIGLHQEQYYHHLDSSEEINALSLWWVCYYLDKISALKTGKLPVIKDESVTAPPLPFIREYCDNLGKDGPRTGLRRKELHKEISDKFVSVLSKPNGYKNLYFVMELDLSIIISKLYTHLLSYNSLKTKDSLVEVISLSNELENWVLCFPEFVRPHGTIFQCFTVREFGNREICEFCIMSDLSLNYFYLKLIIDMLAFRNSTGLTQKKFARQALETAKKLLKFAVAVGQRLLMAAGFSLFYVYSAFLTIAAFCIQEPVGDGIIEDVICLIFSCRELFSSFTKGSAFPEKWIIVGAVARCILYIVVHVVMENNSSVYFDVGDILEEVSEIQKASNHNHLSSYFQDKITSDDKTRQLPRISEVPISSSSSGSSHLNIPTGHSLIPHQTSNIKESISQNRSTNSSNIPSFTNSHFDNFLGLLNEGLPMESNFISNILNPVFNATPGNADAGDDNSLADDYTVSQLDELLNVKDINDINDTLNMNYSS